MSEVRLIDANELRKHAFTTYQSNGVEYEPIKVVPLVCIDNAPTVEEKPQAENALLMDIAHSLAIIADNSTKKGNTQESGNEVLHWVHSEAHKVMCPKCGCRVSINAAYEMNFCFKCGAKLGGIKNDNS